MLACRAQNDLAGYYSRNQAIHDKINEAARNSALRQTYVSVNRRLQALRFRSNFQTPKWDSAIHDHDEMLEGARCARWQDAWPRFFVTICSISAMPFLQFRRARKGAKRIEGLKAGWGYSG